MDYPAFEKAQILRNNGQIDEAVKLYLKVREDALSAKDSHTASECLHMIGVSLHQRNESETSEQYLLQAQEEFEEQHNDRFLGYVLRDRAIAALKQEDFHKAEELLKESISLLERVGDTAHTGISYVKLGTVFAQRGILGAAYSAIHKGILLLKNTSDQFFLSSAYLDLARVDIQNADMTAAREHITQSLHILNSFAKPDEFLSRRSDIESLFHETEN